MKKGRTTKRPCHPLHKLKECLGNEKPLTYSELEKVLGIPYSTLAAVGASQRGRGGIPMGLQARIQSKIGALWDASSLQWRFFPNRKESMMDLQRAKSDRDHLIRELAEMLLLYVEMAPKGSIDTGPASKLYNRAQDLVGWKDGE